MLPVNRCKHEKLILFKQCFNFVSDIWVEYVSKVEIWFWFVMDKISLWYRIHVWCSDFIIYLRDHAFVRLELWGEAKFKEESESDDQFNVSLELEAVTILTQASLC